MSRNDGCGRCESCGNAIWDSGDASVGVSPYVEDCKAQVKSIENQWEKLNADPDYQCPFYVKQYEKEWERTRCTECNSPNTVYIGNIPDVEETYKAKYKCKDCGANFIANVVMW